MKVLRIATVFLLIAGCLLLQSCQQGELLQVKGINFDELTAETYTTEQMWRRACGGEEFVYNGPLYHVFNEHGELYLNVASSNDTAPFSVYTGYHQLFADSLGEWGGWVSAANFYSELSQGIVNPENVITGKEIHGLYQKQMFDPVVYILAGIYNDQTVYRYTDLKEEGWRLDVVAELDLVPNATILDGDKLIIAAQEKLLSLDVGTGETTVLYDEEIWRYPHYNSMVKIGGSYFIGSNIGIHEYRISEGKMLFYPYPDYVPEEE